MTDNEYPIKLSISGTSHYISVKRANEIIRDMNEQIDAVFAKYRKKPSVKQSHKIVGDNIRRERYVLGLTAAWVAKQAGISVSFLSDVENGKRGIASERLVRIASAIGCKIEDLVWGL